MTAGSLDPLFLFSVIPRLPSRKASWCILSLSPQVPGTSVMIYHFASRGQHHQELICGLIVWVGSVGISLFPPSLFSPCPAFGSHTEKGYFQRGSVVSATDGQEGGPENSSSIGWRPVRSLCRRGMEELLSLQGLHLALLCPCRRWLSGRPLSATHSSDFAHMSPPRVPVPKCLFPERI